MRSIKYQTKINLIYNVLTFVINALIGIVLPSFLVSKLGMSTYSLIPLSMSITSFMLVITIAINGTLSRFLSIDFEKQVSNVNKTFSTSFFSLLGVFLFFLPICIVFLSNPQLFLNIQNEDLQSARILFSTTILAFILNAFASLYNSIAFVKNRIDLRNIALIINRLGIIVVLVILFFCGYITVEAYGIAVLIATLSSVLYSYKTALKLYNQLSIDVKLFDKESFKKLFKLGFWLIINQIGVLLFLQTDIIIVNKLLGAEQSGVYGTILQWSFLLRTIIGIVSGVIGPLVLSLYAQDKIKELISLTKFSTKILGVCSAIISVMIMYFSKDILYLWIGKEFIIYSDVLILTVFHLGFNLAFSSIINLNIAYDKAKYPGLVTIITGLINICLGILLIKYTDLGLYGIAIAGMVSLTLKNLIFTPIYAARIMNINLTTYLKPVIPAFLITICGFLISRYIPSSLLHISNYFELGLYSCLFLLIISLISYFLTLNSNERAKLKSVVYSKINK